MASDAGSERNVACVNGRYHAIPINLVEFHTQSELFNSRDTESATTLVVGCKSPNGCCVMTGSSFL